MTDLYIPHVPSIRLTDPNNRDFAPSPNTPVQQSPSGPDARGRSARAAGRPTTPSTASRASSARPESSSGWTSPTRLMRTLSSNATSVSSRPRESEEGKSEEMNGTSAVGPAHIDPLSEVSEQAGNARSTKRRMCHTDKCACLSSTSPNGRTRLSRCRMELRDLRPRTARRRARMKGR